MRRFLLVVFTTILASAALFAQTPTGTLSGTVTSPEGAVVPGATVEIVFKQTGKVQTVTTGDDGGYKVTQLEPGLYSVTVKAPGFKTFVANDVKVDIGREYTLPSPLTIGEVSETVTVTAGADVITSTSAQVTNTVSPQQILSLPLLTRNPLSLTTLQAGTASNPFQGTSINGQRTTLTNTTRDGISINDQFIRTNATDFAPGRPSVDDTGEFTIATTNIESYQALGGAQIILVTPRLLRIFTELCLRITEIQNSALTISSIIEHPTLTAYNRLLRKLLHSATVISTAARSADRSRFPALARERRRSSATRDISLSRTKASAIRWLSDIREPSLPRLHVVEHSPLTGQRPEV